MDKKTTMAPRKDGDFYMTKSESAGRMYIKSLYPSAIILKVPDYKQTGTAVAQGFPDFLVVDNGVFFIEVKMIKGTILRSHDFTPAQIYMFPKIMHRNTRIYVLCYYSKSRKKMVELPKTFDSSFTLDLACDSIHLPLS